MPLSVIDATGTARSTSIPSGTVYHFAGTAFSLAVATPTAVIVIKAPAAKTLYLHRVKVSGAATAAGSMPIFITKRTTDGTPGSAVLTAIVPCKDATGSATNTGSVSTVGTANYTTLGTAAGIAGAGRINFVALGTHATNEAGNGTPYEFAPKKPIALTAGSTEEFTVELGGAAVVAGGVIDYEIVTEEV